MTITEVGMDQTRAKQAQKALLSCTFGVHLKSWSSLGSLAVQKQFLTATPQSSSSQVKVIYIYI